MTTNKIAEYFRRKKYIKNHIIRHDHVKGKIRISIVTGQLAAGGVERVLLSIIQGLPANSFEITVYITDFSNNTWMDRFSEHANIVHITKVLDWSTDETLISDYLSASILVNKSDVIFITNSTAGYRSLSKINRTNLLKGHPCRSYDLLHTHGTSSEADAFLKISLPYDKYLTSRIVISHYLKDYYCNKYPVSRDKIIVIHNGLPVEIKTKDNNTTYGSEFLKLKNSERAITYVGRLQSDKSPQRLVDLAFASRFILSEQNAFIAVVGEGNMREELEQKSRELGIIDSAIRFYGFTDHTSAVMTASYFTILTSNLEGVPMSMLESMDVGTPVIAPNVGGIPEIMPVDTGVLVDFANSVDENEKMINLKQGLERALNLDRHIYQSMKNRAKINVDNNFKHMEKDYLNLFTYGTRTIKDD